MTHNIEENMPKRLKTKILLCKLMKTPTVVAMHISWLLFAP
jgi:hypothetical protein